MRSLVIYEAALCDFEHLKACCTGGGLLLLLLTCASMLWRTGDCWASKKLIYGCYIQMDAPSKPQQVEQSKGGRFSTLSVPENAHSCGSRASSN
jgi:hypothetical protein